jgi:hypothetical protein
VDSLCLQQVKILNIAVVKVPMKMTRIFSKKLAKFAQLLGILNIKPTLFQKFSRMKLHNAFALPIILYGKEI